MIGFTSPSQRRRLHRLTGSSRQPFETTQVTRPLATQGISLFAGADRRRAIGNIVIDLRNLGKGIPKSLLDRFRQAEPSWPYV
jgi:hypothetical protein